MFDSIKKFLARRAVRKIVKLVNKYEDNILMFVPSTTVRMLIDIITDMLEKIGDQKYLEKIKR